MTDTLTALYDLDRSPVTFDFAYALAQAEVQRRLDGRDRLVMYIRGSLVRPTGAAYAAGEAEWRLRHILAPLAGLLEQPADLVVDPRDPPEPVFDKPGGLHWFSDVVLLAEAGQDVQVFRAAAHQRAAVARDLAQEVAGRRLVTVTLRETVYAATRNSDLSAWATLCRRIPRETCAVVVLRDLDKVSEPLPGDWGKVITYPAAVWSLGRRMALYEEAWLNLGVNNGPMVLPILNRACRFLIFKMLLDTPETSRQHFRRLGVEPGTTFPFLGPDQRLVWEGDDAERLCDLVLPLLEGRPFPAARPAAPAQGALIDAARRDYRWGLRGSSSIACLPPGVLRETVEPEAAVMRREEARLPAGGMNRAGPAPTSRDATLADRGSPANGGQGGRTIHLPEDESEADMLDRLAASRSCGPGAGRRIASRRQASGVLSAAALFPDIVGFCEAAEAPGIEEHEPPARSSSGLPPTLPRKAAAYLKSWRDGQGIGERAFALVDGPVDGLRSDGLHTVVWQALRGIWPIEMLAAVVAAAELVETRDPLAIRLRALFQAVADQRRPPISTAGVADALRWRGLVAADPVDALVALAACVRLDPNDPDHRWAFARRFSSCDWSIPEDVGTGAELAGLFEALALVFDVGGPVAAACEPAASRLLVGRGTLVAALVAAAGRSGAAVFERLAGPVLNEGPQARLLCSLVGGTRVDEGDLLDLLEGVRVACGWALVGGAEPPDPLPPFIEALARQVWIQDGPLLGWDDDDLAAALKPLEDATATALLRRLFPD